MNKNITAFDQKKLSGISTKERLANINVERYQQCPDALIKL